MNKNLVEETKNIIKENNLFVKKKYGQNFLVDDKIINEIAGLEKNKKIVEIGPGLGYLTEKLQEKNKVVGIEIDEKLSTILNEKFKEGNVNIINEDFLKTDLDKINKQYFDGEKITFFSNLPYNITAKAIQKIIMYDNFDNAYLMVQKEWANKIIKKEKSTFIIFLINLLCEINIIKNVGKYSFFPSPRVESVVIKLTPKKTIKIYKKQKENLQKMFNQKRKKIKHLLPKDKQQKIEKFGINTNKRIEELSQEEIIDFEKIWRGYND